MSLLDYCTVQFAWCRRRMEKKKAIRIFVISACERNSHLLLHTMSMAEHCVWSTPKCQPMPAQWYEVEVYTPSAGSHPSLRYLTGPAQSCPMCPTNKEVRAAHWQGHIIGRMHTRNVAERGNVGKKNKRGCSRVMPSQPTTLYALEPSIDRCMCLCHPSESFLSLLLPHSYMLRCPPESNPRASPIPFA